MSCKSKNNISGYCIIHNGCGCLEYDANVIKDELNVLGLSEVDSEIADIFIILGCTFSMQKEHEFEKLLNDIYEYKNFHLIIASGCFLRKKHKNNKLHYIKKGEIQNFISKYFHLTPLEIVSTLNPIQNITISEGCYGNCAYCSVKLARGRHLSRDIGDICKDIEKSSSLAYIKFVGQDIGAYGLDKDTDIWQLLKYVFQKYPTQKIKLGPIGIKWLLESKFDDIALLSHNNITGNIHIPIQSASNKILRKMRREYSLENFYTVYNTLLSYGVKNISTDIMAGFPSETEMDHQENIKFLKKYSFSFAQIFMYEPREKTEAFEMKDIAIEVKSRRTTDLISTYLCKYSKDRKLNIVTLLSRDTTRLPFNTNLMFKDNER
ncbi:MAG: radical SAM protein [Sedimentisphaeraceae bacterium JB056]